MGGRFPSGSEFNLREDAVASQYALENWEGTIVFSGVEIGYKIKSGLPLIHNKDIENSPVKDVFRICIPLAKEDSAGRMSWDETAVLVALAGHAPWYKLRSGKIQMKADGTNAWIPGKGSHHYLVEAMPPARVEALINKLLMHQPRRSK